MTKALGRPATWLLVILLGTAAAAAGATSVVATPATSPAAMTSPTTGPTTTAAAPPADDFAPGAFIVVVLAIVILCVAAVVIALLLGAAVAAALAVFVALGVLSSSVFIGAVRGRPAAAVRAFVVQAAALLGAPFGVAVAWLVVRRGLHLAWPFVTVAGLGALYGLATGAATGWCAILLATKLARTGAAWIECRRKPLAVGPIAPRPPGDADGAA